MPPSGALGIGEIFVEENVNTELADAWLAEKDQKPGVGSKPANVAMPVPVRTTPGPLSSTKVTVVNVKLAAGPEEVDQIS